MNYSPTAIEEIREQKKKIKPEEKKKGCFVAIPGMLPRTMVFVKHGVNQDEAIQAFMDKVGKADKELALYASLVSKNREKNKNRSKKQYKSKKQKPVYEI